MSSSLPLPSFALSSVCVRARVCVSYPLFWAGKRSRTSLSGLWNRLNGV